ncbi:hypothetical protein BGZ76_001353 [Entomortierella beljakovae]|nr:hypothetical protein BGZ76_001353 [Entomortierella beljakovae]
MDPRKLKVNELKEQLQLVGLSVNGKKEELVARLLEHQKAEEEAVNAGGPPTGTGDTFEWDESKFDVDDLAPPSDPAPTTTKTTTETSVVAPSTVVSAAPTTLAPKKDVEIPDTKPSVSKTPNTSTTTTTGSVQFQGAIKDPESLKAELEKRKNRAARFGIPLTEQDKAAERAARFGVPVSASVTASLAKVTGTAASPKPIPAKPGSIAAQLPSDVLNKRKERFGIQTPVTSSSIGGSKKSSIVIDAAEEEKKRKRAEKFGLVGNDSNKKSKV